MREEGRKNSVGVSEKNRRTWDVCGSSRWDEKIEERGHNPSAMKHTKLSNQKYFLATDLQCVAKRSLPEGDG